MPEIRLQRAIAEAGVASRRGAEALISAGRVRVDGRPAVIGERVDVERQRVEVDGRQLGAPQRFVYLAVSKPAGVTSTVRDRHAQRTVLDLVPASLSRNVRLYPVGRLDRDSEGLLLLTNDGALTERLLHPRYGIEREYAVALERPLDHSQQDALRRGIQLLEGSASLASLRPATRGETEGLDRLVWPPPDPAMAWYRVVLGEGRKRQVRRMFGAVGATVQRLVRVRIGPLTLDDLAPGGVRPLSATEIEGLRAAASGSDGPERAVAAADHEDGRRKQGPTAAEAVAKGVHALVVALDGPGSSGKSTVGSAAAQRLGYRFCDTGMLYRAVTWLSIERDVPAADGERLAAFVAEVELVPEADGRLSRLLVAGEDVTEKVAVSRVDRRVSDVSAQPAVRAALLPRQRHLAEGGGIVMAGRDIGTVVLPDADLKLFLDASAEERARRRAEQRGLTPNSPAATRILEDLRRRDRIDATRPIAPLRQAPDAVVIRTDGNTVDQTIEAVVAAIRERERELGTGGKRTRA
jgi:cytidylate kinase